MSKRRLILLLIFIGLVIAIWQLPALLRAIPSRYVAAYLPQPVQALAAREQDELLPAVTLEVDAEQLLLPQPIISVQAQTTTGSNSDGFETTPAADGSEPAMTQTPTSSIIMKSTVAIEVAVVEATPIPSPTLKPIPPDYRLESFHHQFQTWNNCGPATLAMALSYFALNVSQEDTAAFLKPNPEDRNVSPDEMASYVNAVTDFEAIDRTNGDLDMLRRLIAAGFPVIVELGIDPPGEYRWMGWYGHYLLVVAYDDTGENVWVYDSWFGTSEVPGENADAEGRSLSYSELQKYWRQFNNNYIVLFRAEDESEVTGIIGSQMNDETMWQDSLVRVQEDLQADPENAFLWFNLGTIHNALGNYEKAALAFDQARTIGLPWRMLWYQFGPYEAYYQVGRYEDVITLADLTLKDRPYFEESYYYRGLAKAALGDIAESQKDFQKAVDFNPRFTPAADALHEQSS